MSLQLGVIEIRDRDLPLIISRFPRCVTWEDCRYLGYDDHRWLGSIVCGRVCHPRWYAFLGYACAAMVCIVFTLSEAMTSSRAKGGVAFKGSQLL